MDLSVLSLQERLQLCNESIHTGIPWELAGLLLGVEYFAIGTALEISQRLVSSHLEPACDAFIGDVSVLNLIWMDLFNLTMELDHLRAVASASAVLDLEVDSRSGPILRLVLFGTRITHNMFLIY